MAGRGGEDNENLVFVTLNSGGNSGGFRTEPGEHLVTHSLTGEGFDASEDGTGRGTPVVFQPQASASQSMNPSVLAPSMGTTKELGVLHHGVRRLTPIECARLQGFPDDWLCLCQQIPCVCPDGPQYRALGNAVTVNVIEWFGKQFRTEGAA